MRSYSAKNDTEPDRRWAWAGKRCTSPGMLLRVAGCSRYTTQLLSQPHTALLTQISTHAVHHAWSAGLGCATTASLAETVEGVTSQPLEPFHTLINCQRAAGARCLTIHRAVGLWKRGKLCYSLARLIYVASQLALSNCSRLVSFTTDASPALYAARPLAQWANADRSPQPFLPMTTPISPPLVCLVHTMRYMSGAMQFSRG